MLDKIWVLIERPSPAEEPQNIGASNDEDYIDWCIKALRSVSRDNESYWKEAIDFMEV